MLNRRGFLGAMLAACAAPAIVKAEILMPVRQIIVPSTGTGEFVISDPSLTIARYGELYDLSRVEIGQIESFRFIESPALSKFQLNGATRNMRRNAAKPVAGNYVVFAHSEWATELR